MSDFFAKELKVATKETCKARWCAGKPGQFFRCGFCGYKFVEGDKYRVLYTNDMPGASGNPIVCEACAICDDESTEALRARWKAKAEEWANFVNRPDMWHFTRRDDQPT